MSKSVITDSILKDIADAIRAKTGGAGKLTPAQMATEIAAIPAGGGATEPYLEYVYDSKSRVVGVTGYGFSKLPDYMLYKLRYLASITFNNGTIIKIGDGAFSYAGANTLAYTIPETVTDIGYNAFDHFYGTIANASLPDGITFIRDEAFRNAKFTELHNLPAELSSVSANCFAYCKGIKGNFTLHENIYTVSASAFSRASDSSQDTLKIMGSPTVEEYAFSYTYFKKACFYMGGCTLSDNIFTGCSKLTDIYVTWPEGDVAGAPWGATNATIHYDTTYDANGDPIA